MILNLLLGPPPLISIPASLAVIPVTARGAAAGTYGVNVKDFSASVNKDLYGAFMQVVKGAQQGKCDECFTQY